MGQLDRIRRRLEEHGLDLILVKRRSTVASIATGGPAMIHGGE